MAAKKRKLKPDQVVLYVRLSKTTHAELVRLSAKQDAKPNLRRTIEELIQTASRRA